MHHSPRRWHLSIQVTGAASAALPAEGSVNYWSANSSSSSSQVVYPTELNGCDVPLIAFPPESMAKGVNLLGGEPIYLKVDILQSNTEGPELKALPLGSPPPSILIASPARPSPTKGGRRGQHDHRGKRAPILGAGLDTSEHASGSSTPMKCRSQWSWSHLCPPNLEDFPKPVDMSSQVSTPKDAEMENASLEEIPAPSSPTAEAPGPNSDALSPRCGSSLERGQQGPGGPASSQIFH